LPVVRRRMDGDLDRFRNIHVLLAAEAGHLPSDALFPQSIADGTGMKGCRSCVTPFHFGEWEAQTTISLTLLG
jgi:hypothetical protein